MPRFNDTDYTAESLAKMNGSALISLYNAAVGELARAGTTELRPVNKFSDKATAVKRTMSVLETLEAVKAPTNPLLRGAALAAEEQKAKASDETDIDIFGEAEEMHRELISQPATDVVVHTPAEDDALQILEQMLQTREQMLQSTAGDLVEKPAKKERTPRVPRFVFPVNTIKPHREGTARDKAVKLLSRPEGATFEEVAEATGWDTFKKCYEGIRLLHFYLGYGMRQDAAGRIYLRTK